MTITPPLRFDDNIVYVTVYVVVCCILPCYADAATALCMRALRRVKRSAGGAHRIDYVDVKTAETTYRQISPTSEYAAYVRAKRVYDRLQTAFDRQTAVDAQHKIIGHLSMQAITRAVPMLLTAVALFVFYATTAFRLPRAWIVPTTSTDDEEFVHVSYAVWILLVGYMGQIVGRALTAANLAFGQCDEKPAVVTVNTS